MFKVTLSACQNPDFPRRSDLPARTTAEVAALWEAAEVCQRFIEGHGLGGGNWSGGQVRDAVTGKLVALVSYNGRVWTTERRWQDRKEIALERSAS